MREVFPLLMGDRPHEERCNMLLPREKPEHTFCRWTGLHRELSGPGWAAPACGAQPAPAHRPTGETAAPQVISVAPHLPLPISGCHSRKTTLAENVAWFSGQLVFIENLPPLTKRKHVAQLGLGLKKLILVTQSVRWGSELQESDQSLFAENSGELAVCLGLVLHQAGQGRAVGWAGTGGKASCSRMLFTLDLCAD